MTHRPTRLFALCTLMFVTVSLSGCLFTTDTGGTGAENNGSNGTDTYNGDANGGDADDANDGNGCDPACAGDKSVCHEGTCVVCTDEEGCDDQQICIADGDPVNNFCGECESDADCTDPGAAQCDDNECVACESGEHCRGVENAGVCDSSGGGGGTCVECTVEDTSACGEMACDVRAGTCTDRPTNQKGQCEECVSDRECLEGYRCIPMNFEAQEIGTFCLRDYMASGTSCERPFDPTIERESISGHEATSYCAVAERLTTCPAVLAMKEGKSCTGNPDACPEGGICRRTSGLADGEQECTVYCDAEEQCTSSNSCESISIGERQEEFCGAVADL